MLLKLLCSHRGGGGEGTAADARLPTRVQLRTFGRVPGEAAQEELGPALPAAAAARGEAWGRARGRAMRGQALTVGWGRPPPPAGGPVDLSCAGAWCVARGRATSALPTRPTCAFCCWQRLVHPPLAGLPINRVQSPLSRQLNKGSSVLQVPVRHKRAVKAPTPMHVHRVGTHPGSRHATVVIRPGSAAQPWAAPARATAPQGARRKGTPPVMQQQGVAAPQPQAPSSPQLAPSAQQLHPEPVALAVNGRAVPCEVPAGPWLAQAPRGGLAGAGRGGAGCAPRPLLDRLFLQPR